ncbi:MAG: hypothetical protein K9I97_01155 [Cryomorphaceae bacterium]|jgi:hypothetical protein|nr:hypothetical protein [Cryomorphaceae bacterium]
MKTILSLALSLVITSVLFSQDLIVLKNGTQINGSILEVTPSLVKFKKTSDGPVYSMNLTDLSSITYKNGTVENYGPAPIVSNSNKPNTPAGPDPIEDEMLIPTKRYGGPRVGLTYISAGTTRTRIADAFNRADITPFVSQFGWQFETRIFTLENGAAGLIEFIPLIGGIEQGLFLPSASGIIGFRGANGVEFGVGPSASLAGFGIVMAAGASFKVGKITFPINIAFSPNIKKILPDEQVYDWNTGTYQTIPGETTNSGFRLSLLVGFNSRKG